MTTTVSDAFAVPSSAAVAPGIDAVAPENPRLYTRIRARGVNGVYSSLSVTRKVNGWTSTAWADLRRAWWTPASLPTVQQAWTQRKPDRSTVPGDNAPLYVAWLIFNHTVGLLVPVVATAAIGILAAAVWVASHPARFLLAAIVAAPLIVTALIR